MIDIQLIQEFGSFFLDGLKTTLFIALFSCMLGIILGSLAGIVLTSNSKILRGFVMSYVIIIRGTPMYIQITAIYFLLLYLGIAIPAVYSAILSIGLNSGAYLSQIVVSGIKAVHKGQIDAAKVLGLSSYQIATLIILPQATRTMIPAFGNELITLIKDSSLASTIGVCELTKQGNIVLSHTYDVPTVFFVLVVMYLMVTSLVSLIVSYFDKKLNKHAHR